MSENIYNLVSKNIKYNRKKLNYTQGLLAEKSGYSHEFIRRIEAPNMKKSFSLNTIYQIANALNIDVWELFYDKNEENDIDDKHTE